MAPPSRVSGGSLRDYLQLVRLPNVFTAMADVLMGYLFTHDPAPLPTLKLPADFWALLLASSSLYCAGMVLNDVNDIEADRLRAAAAAFALGPHLAGFRAAIGLRIAVVRHFAGERGRLPLGPVP